MYLELIKKLLDNKKCSYEISNVNFSNTEFNQLIFINSSGIKFVITDDDYYKIYNRLKEIYLKQNYL